METLRIWTDEDKLEKIKRLPKTFVVFGKDETQGNLIIYDTPEARQRIIHILNDEE